MKEKRIGSATVRLLQGDITACEVDAVINVTGKTLVSYDEEDAPVPVQLDPKIWEDHDGEHPVVLTSADDIRAHHILNAPIVETTSTSGANKIRKTMRRILEEAQQNQLKTLAVPAIGSGVNRYPIERCAEILLEELSRSVHQANNSIEKVIFVLQSQKSYRIFEQVLDDYIEAERAKD